MIEQMKSMPIEELQFLLNRLELLDSIQAANFLELSPATLRNPKNIYRKSSIKLGQYLFWRKGDLKMSHTIKFNYVGDYDESGPIARSGEITIQRYGTSGWLWNDGAHAMRTNEEGDGCWMNGRQILGTTQYSLPRDSKRALLKLARERANFNSVLEKPEKFRYEFV
jgi:hypothetical protein